MITSASDITIERSNDFKESFFKADLGSPEIFKILRSSIYSDAILACVREITFNALDAHAYGNKNIPIKVKLPNAIDPSISIRDYGPGLSEDDVRNIFCSYGASTKNKSNDYVGLLGIGAKSPFAYTSSFQIISYFGGEKLIFNAYIDETEMGKLALLNRESSNEETGIEISIPVKNGDIPTFICKCQYIFRFLDIHPNVVGNTSYVHELNEYVMQGEGWGFIDSKKVNSVGYSISFPIITMGGCPYNINSDKIEELNSVQRNILNNNLILFAPIGSIDIAASREEVKYTPKTIKFIKDKLLLVEAEAKKIIDEKFSHINSLYEAYKLYSEYKDSRSIYYAILNNNYCPKYKDRAITQDYFYIPSDDKWIEHITDINCEKTYSYSNNERFYNSKNNSLNFNSSNNFFLCNSYKPDFQDTKIIKRRYRFFAKEKLKSNPSFMAVNVSYITFKSQELKEQWINDNGIPLDKIICIDTIEIPKVVRAKKVAQPIINEQYAWKYDATSDRFGNIKIDVSKIAGYYLKTWYSSSFIVNDNFTKMSEKNNLGVIVKLLKKIDSSFLSDVYLIHPNPFIKKNINLLPFDIFATNKIKEYLKNNPINTIKHDQVYCRHLTNIKKVLPKLNIDQKYIDAFNLIEINNGNTLHSKFQSACAILKIEFNTPKVEDISKILNDFSNLRYT